MLKGSLRELAAMTERAFYISVMGKTLEHLGSQLYKRRDAAIAELVANSWDAGAEVVNISIPHPQDYSQQSSTIAVSDTGSGMSVSDIDNHYLVIGRNRRLDQPSTHGRPIMGRKGIGKLAGFGIAKTVKLTTWVEGTASSVLLPIEDLKKSPGSLNEVELRGEVDLPPPDDLSSESGTRVELSGLRHVTPIAPDDLRKSLSRRFSRTIRGQMEILVNGEPVQDPEIEFDYREPAGDEAWCEEDINGNTVRYFFGFSPRILTPSENRGFVVYAHLKTAQAPPYFFDVEATASGQHGTRYLFGAIEADFLDDDSDDENDVISTDRQEIDWEHPRAKELKEWGAILTRRALREHRDRKEDTAEDWVRTEPALSHRIEQLDKHSRQRVTTFIRSLGGAEDADKERILRLSHALVSAFEYQHFHDFLSDLEDVGTDDPEQLVHLLEQLMRWKSLESRAILEVVQGRLKVVDKFHSMVVNDTPEKAHLVGDDNLHDLLASFPWLLNPEWQVFGHEQSIDKTLKEWEAELEDDGSIERVDFLALASDHTLAVVEIKRPGHAVSLEEFQRLQFYIERLRHAWEQRTGDGTVIGLLVCNDIHFSIDQIGSNIRWERWGDLYRRVKDLYEHYRSLLEFDTNATSFKERQQELAITRSLIDSGSSYIDKSKGKAELGPQ